MRLVRGQLNMQTYEFNDFYNSFDMRIFGYFLNWIHLLRLTLEICCLPLAAQMDFVTEAILCNVFRPGDGESITPICNVLET